MRGGALVASLAFTAACPGPSGPRQPQVQPLTLAVGREGAALRAIASSSDGARAFAAFELSGDRTSATDAAAQVNRRTAVEAFAHDQRAWSAALTGGAGPMAARGTGGDAIVAIALSGSGELGDNAASVRGEPGALLVALDAASGKPRWRLAFDTNEWLVVSSLAGGSDGFVVGGSFSGSLRVKDTVVTSGAKSDGFVAKVTADGALAWLLRIGGPGADAVQGVATRGDRIAVAGTFAAGADVLGTPLPAFDEKSPFADGFVAAFDANGARTWSASFGGKQAETIAGVAIDERGGVVVAGSARDVVHVGGLDLEARGSADGLVAWWNADGSANHAVLVGGTDFDGVRAIAAVGDRIVVGGFYSGTIDLGADQLVAGGGDGAFVATFDRRGAVVGAFDIAGAGREEIVGLAAAPGGIVAGVAHTADTSITGAQLAAPKDPMTGAALVIRGVR